MNADERVSIMLNCLSIDKESFYKFEEWALSEQLVNNLIKENKQIKDYLSKQDGLKKFRDYLKKTTKRNWSVHDLNKLFEAVKVKTEKHYREPIEYGEYLKLLWTMDHKCSKCDKSPPEVKLHIDHIVPVSLGGNSKKANLQFLCEKCNLKKSNKLEGGEPWLDLM